MIFMKINKNIFQDMKVMDWDEKIIADNDFQGWSILTCMSDMYCVHRIVLDRGTNVYLMPERCLSNLQNIKL